MYVQRSLKKSTVQLSKIASAVALVILASTPAIANENIVDFTQDKVLSHDSATTWVITENKNISGNGHSLTVRHENGTKGGVELLGTLKDVKDLSIVNGGLTVHKTATLEAIGTVTMSNSDIRNNGSISAGSLILEDSSKRIYNGKDNGAARLHVENGIEKIFLENYGTVTVGVGQTASFYGLKMKAGSSLTDENGDAVDVVISQENLASVFNLDAFHNESEKFKAKNLTSSVSVKNLAKMDIEGDLTALNFETTADSVTTVGGTLTYGDGPNSNKLAGNVTATHINARNGTFETGAVIEAQTLTVGQNLAVKTGGNGFKIGKITMKNVTDSGYIAFYGDSYSIAEMVFDSSDYEGEVRYSGVQNFSSTLNIGTIFVTGGTKGMVNSYQSDNTTAITNVGTLTVQNKGEFIITAKDNVNNQLTIDSATFGQDTKIIKKKNGDKDNGVTHTTIKELTAEGLTVEELATNSTLSLGQLILITGKNSFNQALTGIGESGQTALNITVGEDASVSFANITADEVSVGLGNLNENAFVATTAKVGKAKVLIGGQLNEGSDAELKNKIENAFKLQNTDVTATVEEGNMRAETTWTQNADGSTSIKTQGVNQKLTSISETTMVPIAQWRAEMNDISLRLGDIRNQNGDNGLWVRTYGGRAKLGSQSVRFDSSSIQMGYDHRISGDNINYYVGGAFSYTDGETKFTTGTGDSSTLAFTAYTSALFDNGSFIDASLKYGKLKNEYGIRYQSFNYDGDYETQALGLTIELGHRFTLSRNLFVEPQLEGMLSHVFGESYNTSHGLSVEQEGMDILIGRVGFMAGVQCPNDRGTVYVRGSYLYDFGSDTSAKYSDGTTPVTIDQDLGGGWFEVGVGASVRFTDKLKGYADFIYSKGSDLESPYRWNAGLRYTW